MALPIPNLNLNLAQSATSGTKNKLSMGGNVRNDGARAGVVIAAATVVVIAVVVAAVIVRGR